MNEQEVCLWLTVDVLQCDRFGSWGVVAAVPLAAKSGKCKTRRRRPIYVSYCPSSKAVSRVSRPPTPLTKLTAGGEATLHATKPLLLYYS